MNGLFIVFFILSYTFGKPKVFRFEIREIVAWANRVSFASLGPEHRPSRGISRTSPAPTIPAHPHQHGSTGQHHGLLQVLQEAPWTRGTNLKDVGILELAVLNALFYAQGLLRDVRRPLSSPSASWTPSCLQSRHPPQHPQLFFSRNRRCGR